MRHRGHDRPFRIAFRETEGWGASLAPSTPDVLETMAEADGGPVLVVPVSLITDNVENRYALDIKMRSRARSLGIERFEVASGLNTHPLLIEALGEAVASQLSLPVDVNQLRVGGDGASQNYELHPPDESPRLHVNGHLPGCPDVTHDLRPRRWTGEEEESAQAVAPGDESASSPSPS